MQYPIDTDYWEDNFYSCTYFSILAIRICIFPNFMWLWFVFKYLLCFKWENDVAYGFLQICCDIGEWKSCSKLNINYLVTTKTYRQLYSSLLKYKIEQLLKKLLLNGTLYICCILAGPKMSLDNCFEIAVFMQ